MKTYFYISEPKDKSKNSRIRMRLRDGREINLYALTEEYIPAKYWDNSSHWVRTKSEFPRMRDIISSLNDLKAFIDNKYFEDKKAGKIEKKWLSESIELFYHPDMGKPDEPNTLFEFIRKFIDDAPKRKNPDTSKAICYKQTREYERTFHYLKKFCEQQGREYDFQDMDLEFYEDWVEYMEGLGLALNTIGKKVQTLKIFLNDAVLNDYPVNKKFKHKRFKNLTEDSDQIYLDMEELGRIDKLDLSNNPGRDIVRDQFLIAAWTGCRFDDIKQVTKKNINEKGMIYISQGKTGTKLWVPMYPVVKAILEKYNYEMPPMISNQKFNDHLKVIAEKAEINAPFHKTITKGGKTVTTKHIKHELVTAHCARRSFATNLYKDGVPPITIMQNTGHKTESAFLRYIKVTPEEHAEILMEHWQKKQEHLRVV